MTDDRALSISVTDAADGSVVVALAGELDLASAPSLVAELEALRGRAGRLVIDAARLSFIDSSGLNALVATARATDRPIVLAGASEHVSRVVEMVRLEEILQVAPSVEEALRRPAPTRGSDGEAA
jgi:anti-anti-sigma factor